MTSTRDLRKDFLTSLEINEKNYSFSSHSLEKMWEYEKLSQRSKNVLLDPGIAIYLEE